MVCDVYIISGGVRLFVMGYGCIPLHVNSVDDEFRIRFETAHEFLRDPNSHDDFRNLRWVNEAGIMLRSSQMKW